MDITDLLGMIARGGASPSDYQNPNFHITPDAAGNWFNDKGEQVSDEVASQNQVPYTKPSAFQRIFNPQMTGELAARNQAWSMAPDLAQQQTQIQIASEKALHDADLARGASDFHTLYPGAIPGAADNTMSDTQRYLAYGSPSFTSTYAGNVAEAQNIDNMPAIRAAADTFGEMNRGKLNSSLYNSNWGAKQALNTTGLQDLNYWRLNNVDVPTAKNDATYVNTVAPTLVNTQGILAKGANQAAPNVAKAGVDLAAGQASDAATFNRLSPYRNATAGNEAVSGLYTSENPNLPYNPFAAHINGPNITPGRMVPAGMASMESMMPGSTRFGGGANNSPGPQIIDSKGQPVVMGRQPVNPLQQSFTPPTNASAQTPVDDYEDVEGHPEYKYSKTNDHVIDKHTGIDVTPHLAKDSPIIKQIAKQEKAKQLQRKTQQAADMEALNKQFDLRNQQDTWAKTHKTMRPAAFQFPTQSNTLYGPAYSGQ